MGHGPIKHRGKGLTMADVVAKSKLVMKDLANPKNVVGDSHKEPEYFMGTVIGIASGLKQGADPQGKPFTGLKGNFEGIPSDPERDTVKAGVCYLPSGFQEPIETLLASGEPTVKFAFEVYSIKSTAPIGYSYMLKAVTEPGAADPLSDLRRLALPPPVAEGEQPAAEKGRGRRKAA
jgi:hypothetical protein